MNVWLPIVLGGIATLAVYSFLIKENPFYRFFEHTYIGIATGFGIVFGIQRFIWPQLLRPMLGYDCEPFAGGGQDRPWRSWYLVYLLPAAFGTLYYFIYSRKRQWLSRVVIAWSLGVSGGFALKGFFAQYMPQIIGSFKPLVTVRTVERSLLIGFGDIAGHLPDGAQIVKGRLELYRLGPSYARLVVKRQDGQLSEVRGRVSGVNPDPKNGSITLVVNEQEKTFQSKEVVLQEDLEPRDAADAYEGHGGEHEYLAYRVLRPWGTTAVGEEALAKALRTADGAGRVQAVEDVLHARLALADVRAVMKLDAGNASQAVQTAQALVRLGPDDYAPTAETNSGLVLQVRDDQVVRDPYRGLKWTVGKRESIGVKSCELSADTLRSWYDRPESDYGVILQRKGGAGGSFLHRFASSTHPVAARRPKLVIEYLVAGDEKLKELVLQNGLDGYEGTSEAVIASDVDTPLPQGQEFLLGASARKHNGGLSLDWWSSSGMLANWIFAVTLICVMTYFLFSLEHNRPGIYQASLAGRWLMMLCFGAFFGSTIMARMALLVERLQFLIQQWLPTIFGLG
ncbi:MAG: hypothetical protein ABSE73_20800 [Planctomycetota bacterium]